MGYLVSDFGGELLEDIRTFCQRELREEAAAADRDRVFPEELYEKIRDMGLHALGIPADFGGLGLSGVDTAALLEELAKTDAGLAVTMMVNMMAQVPAQITENQEMQELVYNCLLEGGYGAFALTEDQAGSDPSGLRMTATPEGDGYRLNGTKIFVTNGPIADFFNVFAKTEQGITAFLVSKDAEGITAGTEERKMGIRNSCTSEVDFQDVYVPAEQRLGQEGKGLSIALKALDYGRVDCAVVAVGIAQRALEESIAYAKRREQFGAPLSQNEVIQCKLADMQTKTEAARQLCAYALTLADRGQPFAHAAAAAKNAAGAAAMYAASEAIQIFGGNGYCEDYPVEKLLRDAKIFQIFEGTEEIQKLVIARQLLR